MILNILFIGNSHTYYNYMPQMLSMLVKAGIPDLELSVEQCTGEGASLEWHWHNPSSRKAIRNQPWDYVVLQDRSGGPLENRSSFVKYAGLLDDEIRNQNGETIFFMTWANRSRPQTQATLAEAYTTVSESLSARLAPVGLVWDAVLRLNPGCELYHVDGRHASPVGSYLTACVFYALIFNKNPQGLPGRFHHKGKTRLNLEKDLASLLQKIVWQKSYDLKSLTLL